MGGYGSGRHGGKPTVEDGLTVDLGLMLRRGWARAGASGAGTLSWSRNGEPCCSISHHYDLTDLDNAHLTLTYTRTPRGGAPEKVEQLIRLTWTRPTYGGRRWWMICPHSGRRVAKLHLPPGGDRFASRLAWRLPYRSQRSAHRDRPFDKLFRLQRKLGSPEGWEAGLRRPKGMWRRTYERHLDRYWQLDGPCAVEMMGLVSRLSR
jgi:hypothetical protein